MANSAGLVQVFPKIITPAIATDFDIVAIHGLAGHQIPPWTSPSNNNTVWIRDFLKIEFPRARIFTFGYNTQVWLGKSTSTVRDVAGNLLSRLRTERRAYEAKRPIIFICHSLGGIVLKAALVIANERDDDRWLLDAPTGVIFMGTPHRGAGLSAGLNILGGLPGIVVRKEYIKLLKSNSAKLEELCDSFGDRCRKLDSVVCFFEMEVSTRNCVVVSRASGMIDNTRRVGIPADHEMMSRFESPEDGNYKLVLGELDEMVRKVCRGIKISAPDVQDHLRPSVVMDDHFSTREEQSPATSDGDYARIHPYSAEASMGHISTPSLIPSRSFQDPSVSSLSIYQDSRQSRSSSNLHSLRIQTNFVQPGSSAASTFESAPASSPREEASSEIIRAREYFNADDFWNAHKHYEKARRLLKESHNCRSVLFQVYICLTKCCLEMFGKESDVLNPKRDRQIGHLQRASQFLRKGEKIADGELEECWVKFMRLTIQMVEMEFQGPVRHESGSVLDLEDDFKLAKNEALTLRRRGAIADDLIAQIDGVISRIGLN